ncbi:MULTISPECIES: BON domain-containing protein [Spongiibacter]|uniref:BON domain-containing protein n=1 Tax=Spongiibacter TaxID=630749 RepID=UPI000C52D7F3|nr:MULTISPECIES: BON domain-containing protein [Spongiibacter]MBO6751511.1 BON domain-containing protein [Spongiibacter sp.]MBU73214.1 BON domain-containing protein [Spongiibacter sp.]|tara:strand:- start:9013 stop:9573 length:561 start_codon:yes stop_codon:yes gene_type:complete
MTIKKTLITTLTLSALASTPALAETWQGKANDAWIDGKVETAIMLNGELNNFEIDTGVKQGKVTLSGTVTSDIEKDLAGQIAHNVDGVQSVENKLNVEKDYRGKMKQAGENFAGTWNDLTTTAAINMKYATNDDIAATSIDVDTKDGVVTLRGTVKSDAARDLAIEIAKSFDKVTDVEDKLVVRNS